MKKKTKRHTRALRTRAPRVRVTTTRSSPRRREFPPPTHGSPQERRDITQNLNDDARLFRGGFPAPVTTLGVNETAGMVPVATRTAIRRLMK